MLRTKKEEWLCVVFLVSSLAVCICDGGWTAYHENPVSPPGRRHRNVPLPYHARHQGHYDAHPYDLHPSSQGPPVDLSFYPTNHNHRQGHSYSGPRYSNQLAPGSVFHAPTQDYRGFGPTSFSSITNHDGSAKEYEHVSHSPIIFTSSRPHALDEVARPYPGHSSIVTASPLSLGPSHAGFLSASSTLRVADHLDKPSVKKSYKVIEDEGDDHVQRSGQITPYPQHRLDSHSHQTNDRSSSSHPPDSKATSFQSFVLHSFKPVKVLPKKSHDGEETESNEISHKH